MRIDAHHHLWDPAARDYPFLADDSLAPIRRRYDLDDLHQLTATLGVERTVLVQTVSEENETLEFLDAAAQSEGVIAGVVGWVDLMAHDLDDRIRRLRAAPGGRLLVGFRHQIEDEPDAAWAQYPQVVDAVRRIGAAGMTYDLLVREPQWPAALALVRACPETPIVLDHAGKPPIAHGDLSGWSRWIRRLAEHDNVMVKLSGLATEADWGRWEPDDLEPVIDAVMDTFGSQRVMVGSDWPVAEIAGPVHRSWTAVTDRVQERGGTAPLGAVAAKFYALSPTTD